MERDGGDGEKCLYYTFSATRLNLRHWIQVFILWVGQLTQLKSGVFKDEENTRTC